MNFAENTHTKFSELGMQLVNNEKQCRFYVAVSAKNSSFERFYRVNFKITRFFGYNDIHLWGFAPIIDIIVSMGHCR